MLCNRQMYRLSQYLLHSDMQYLGEVERALSAPPAGVTPLSAAENTYRFPDNTVWRFEKSEVTDHYGKTYLQLTAADVTELHQALVQLSDDNQRLAQDAEELRRLSENVEAVAREKEQLAAKAAMHDSLAACITVTKQYLTGDLEGVDAAVILREWEKSIAFRDAVRLPAKETLFDSAKRSGVTHQVPRRSASRSHGGADLYRHAGLPEQRHPVCAGNRTDGEPLGMRRLLSCRNSQ